MKIKNVSLFFSLVFFLSAQNVRATEIVMAADDSYCDLTRDHSNLADVVAEISSWDEDKNSPLWQLHRYIANGHSRALKDAVLTVLAYAENVVEKKSSQLSPDKVDQINDALDQLACLIENGALRSCGFESDEESSCEVECGQIPSCKIEYIRGPRGHRGHRGHRGATGTFNSASCVDNLCVDTLSVVDLFAGSADINCDLTVGCNISMNDSVSVAVGNVIKNGVPFIHTYPAGSLNTFVGQGAGNFSMMGTQNAAFGNAALMNNTTGAGNTTVGSLSLLSNTIGQHNTAVGNGALLSNTTGSFNTAIGFLSMFLNTTGQLNVAIGDTSMTNNITGSQNVTIGVSSFASGDNNVIIGYTAGNNGSQNVGIGRSALFAINADQNVAIGYGSMAGSTSANGNNVAVGYQALFNAQGGSNIAIGSSAGNGSTLSSSENNIYIANNGADESGAIRIGTLGTHTTCFVQGINGVTTGLPAVGVLVDGNGQLGIISSTRNVKHDINIMNNDSEIIYQLNPVTFVYNGDATETKQYGLIAEEVDQVFPAIVVRDEDGNPYTVQYQVLPVLLLNEAQKQHAAIESITNRLMMLEQHQRGCGNSVKAIAHIDLGEEDVDSLLVQQHKYMTNADFCALKQAVLQVMAYGVIVLQNKYGEVSPAQLEIMNDVLNAIPCI